MFVWVFLFYPIPPNNLLQGLFRPYFPCFGLLGSIQGGLILNLRDYRLQTQSWKKCFFSSYLSGKGSSSFVFGFVNLPAAKRSIKLIENPSGSPHFVSQPLVLYM